MERMGAGGEQAEAEGGAGDFAQSGLRGKGESGGERTTEVTQDFAVLFCCL